MATPRKPKRPTSYSHMSKPDLVKWCQTLIKYAGKIKTEVPDLDGNRNPTIMTKGDLTLFGMAIEETCGLQSSKKRTQDEARAYNIEWVSQLSELDLLSVAIANSLYKHPEKLVPLLKYRSVLRGQENRGGAAASFMEEDESDEGDDIVDSKEQSNSKIHETG